MMPLPPVFEKFGPQSISPPTVQVTVGLGAAPFAILPRLWFLTQDETELIQVQQGRFVHNWRRQSDDQPYPRFETLKSHFREELSVFLKFIEQEQLGQFHPNQCEVIYVNLIPLGGTVDTHRDLQILTDTWRGVDTTFRLEGVNLSAHYLLPSDVEDNPTGRLHATWTPVIRNGEKAYQLEMLARGVPKEPSVEGIFDFFRIGHDATLTAFLAMTTSEMHKRWEKILAA